MSTEELWSEQSKETQFPSNGWSFVLVQLPSSLGAFSCLWGRSRRRIVSINSLLYWWPSFYPGLSNLEQIYFLIKESVPGSLSSTLG